MTDKSLVRRSIIQPTEILNQLQSGQLMRVSGYRGNAIIICHRYHAEIAGPGAAVGGAFDIDCRRVIPLGNISIIHPQSRTERQQAYSLRQKWLLFSQHAMKNCVPLQRANSILVLLYKYFEPKIIEQLSDEVIAQLVGVFPKTVGMVRPAFQSKFSSRMQQLESVES